MIESDTYWGNAITFFHSKLYKSEDCQSQMLSSFSYIEDVNASNRYMTDLAQHIWLGELGYSGIVLESAK